MFQDQVNRRHLMTGAAAMFASALSPAVSFAQPTQVARIVLGFPAGGSNDLIARQLAERLRGNYAPGIIVENKVGAQGRLAVDAMKTAAPDGMTILQTPGTALTIYPHVFKKLSYDPLKDLAPVTALCTFDIALAVGPNVPAKTASEFVAWCKKNPDKAMYGSPAAGASPHFVGVMFERAAGIKLQHVGYKGAAPAVQDLIGGHLSAYMGTLGDVIEHHRSGAARVIATSGPKRSRFVPDVMTFEEDGFRNVVAQDWYGILLPATAPSEVIIRLSRSISEAVKDQRLLDSFIRANVDPAVTDPQAFIERIRHELTSWEAVVKASGFRIDD